MSPSRSMPTRCAACCSTCPSRGARRLRWPLALLLAAGSWAHGAGLDEAQRAWLDRQGVVRFAPERDYAPFVFTDEQGRTDGLSVGMLRLVQRHTGLQVQDLPARPLAEQMALAQAREADLLSSLRPTPERAQFLLFSQPYVSVPAVLVVRPGGAASLSALRGQPVAVGAGYAVEAVVRARHPEVGWQPVADDATALRGVADGRYAAAVTDSASLAYVQRRDRLPPLSVAEHVGFEYTLSFAVRSDWPQLRDIIDAGLRSIPLAERQALLARWLPEQDAGAPPLPARAPRATLVAIGMVVAGLGLAAWIGWRRAR